MLHFCHAECRDAEFCIFIVLSVVTFVMLSIAVFIVIISVLFLIGNCEFQLKQNISFINETK